MGVLVDRVERVHQTVPECVSINVERRMNEMRNISPVIPVRVVETQRRAEALALNLEPNLAELIGCQLSFTALVMNFDLEAGERNLADYRVQHILDLNGEHDLAPPRIGLAREQCAKRQRLAKNRG